MEQVQLFLQNIVSWMDTIWNLELFKSGGNSIQFNQVVIAGFHLIVGFIISKKLSTLFARKIMHMGNIDESRGFLIRRILYFGLIALFVLIAMPIAGIPIGAFTILGSAVAIGLGFGAQNLFNNLISSFILLVEKPIRIGDIVVLGDIVGRVADIGNRCVSVRSGDGIDILVPNSHFLEQQVTNWTRSDRNLRGELKVGVAYGSPVEKVRELLEQAAQENENVQKLPAPFVLFDDFGDNALSFTLLFWSRVAKPLDLRRVSSALRFRVDALFRENGIVIAFPQRDIHFDARQPIPVRVTEELADQAQ